MLHYTESEWLLEPATHQLSKYVPQFNSSSDQGANDLTLEPLPGPNAEVLEAQARVCTGPHQARPLGVRKDDPQPKRISALILASLRAKLPWEQRVSPPQMGAFFAAMTIRRRFIAATNWSDVEQDAFEANRQVFEQELDDELLFLLEPERGCAAATVEEEPVIEALSQILRGEHLSYVVTLAACRAILDLRVRASSWPAELRNSISSAT